ncbi:MAG: GNAT family N-acetyltransferase [Flavobacteriaceae bacterium]|nr:GNAT family N-acetyltransferase [Flavobacteriaceae bacterium]
MNNITIKIIPKEEILSILPLLKTLNTTTPDSILTERLLAMVNENYECVGMYDGEDLIGISGLWYITRHYVGKSIEPDHVVVDKNYQNQGLGKMLFDWIYEHAKSKGCEASELNTYVQNRKSHKFYYNEGYEIYGFHFVKILREDQLFY